MCTLSGWDGSTAGDGGLAAQTSCFCRLFTHFQWLIPLESEGTSPAWHLWHCQLPFSTHRRGFMFHSTCLSSVGAHRLLELFLLIWWCLVPSSCKGDRNSSRYTVFWGFGPPNSVHWGFMWADTWVTDGRKVKRMRIDWSRPMSPAHSLRLAVNLDLHRTDHWGHEGQVESKIQK